MSTAERSARKSPPEAFARPGGYDPIGHALEAGFTLYLRQLPPEQRSSPLVLAELRAAKAHLRESREYATPRNAADDIDFDKL